MPSCEKCWSDAGFKAWSSQGDKVEIYGRLVKERDCTPEEQAGPDAEVCPECRRKTIHQHVHYCLVCGKEKYETITI